jgi:hypothetical protein
MAEQRESSPRKRIAPRQQLAAGSSRDRPATSPASFQRQASVANRSGQLRFASQSDSDMEVIILVRSKTDPSVAETITVANPSDKLLGFLSNMEDSAKTARQLDVAQLRRRVEYRLDVDSDAKTR